MGLKSSPQPVLKSIRRGAGADEIELHDSNGHVLLLVAYGLTLEEQAGVRERAMVLLTTWVGA